LHVRSCITILNRKCILNLICDTFHELLCDTSFQDAAPIALISFSEHTDNRTVEMRCA
jgi:hypothetical protein